MSLHVPVFVAVYLLCSQIIIEDKETPESGEFLRLSITIDGKKAFESAELYDKDFIDSTATLQKVLASARFKMSEESPFSKNTAGDLALKGKVELKVHDLSLMSLDSLQLDYVPINGTYFIIFGSWDIAWRIHPEDRMRIVSHLDPIQERLRAAQARKQFWDRWVPVLPGFSALVALIILLAVIVKNRIARQRFLKLNRSVPAPQPS